MPTVDVHNHYYPPEYFNALTKFNSVVKVTYDTEGNPLVHYPGDYNIAVRGHRDIAYRETVLAAEGVDRQILSLTTPGTHVEKPEVAVALAAITNDAFARVVSERGARFSAFATLPLCDSQASVKEFVRAVDQLKLSGAMLFSNVNGEALSDEKFWPIYEVANDLDAVLYIHPTAPVGVEAMQQYWLMPLVGFLMDTTLAAASLVFAGVPERFPRIRWALCHLGGAVPYMAERFDRGFHAFRDCRAHITQPPSTYLRQFYYDTVNFDIHALELAIAFAGADRILAGSDYPHQIGSIPSMLDAIHTLTISDRDRAAILGLNAAKLLSLAAT